MVSRYRISLLKFIGQLLMVLAAPVGAYAGSSEGLVTTPLSHQGVFMFSAGTPVGKPACSTQNSWAVTLDASTGRPMQATILTAYALGKKIHVEGKGVCDAWADRETPSYVYIVD